MGTHDASGIFSTLTKQYEHNLTDRQLEEVERGVKELLDAVLALRSCNLDYTEEPVITFVPFLAHE